jgi:hypothetical protein
MKPPELVSATQAQLDELLALARAASFPQPQYELLAGVLGTFIYVMHALQNAKTSLKRFRQMLFGKRTESTANVLKMIGSGTDGQGGRAAEPAPDDPAALPAGVSKEPKKHKGHGRNSAAAYSGAQAGRLHEGSVCQA